MYEIKDLEKYYVKHLNYNSYGNKNPERYLYNLFEDAPNKYTKLIIKSVIDKKFNFINCGPTNGRCGNDRVEFCLRKNLNKHTAFHELGHLIDFVGVKKVENGKGPRRYLSTISIEHSKTMILSNGLTLKDTCLKELKLKNVEIYSYLFDVYKSITLKYANQDDEDFIETYLNTLNRKNIIYNRIGSNKYYKLKKDFDESLVELAGFNNVDAAKEFFSQLKSINDRDNICRWYKIRHSIRQVDEMKEFLDINDIILDVIGYKYDVVPLWPAHTLGYYQNGKMCLEFFADTFASLMLNKQDSLDSINRFLPKSYNAFCELLDKIYEKTMTVCS